MSRNFEDSVVLMSYDQIFEEHISPCL